VTTLDYLHRHVIPTAYTLLPPAMRSQEATALLLAIALQESGCVERVQLRGGPARSFWQFEMSGLAALLANPRCTKPLQPALATLRYFPTQTELYAAVAHNDVLAAVCARLLLWAVPAPIPDRSNPHEAWRQYLVGWNPGKPRPETWGSYYTHAWNTVEA
jgi:hypothetical protein